jgi:hypothetical protein
MQAFHFFDGLSEPIQRPITIQRGDAGDTSENLWPAGVFLFLDRVAPFDDPSIPAGDRRARYYVDQIDVIGVQLFCDPAALLEEFNQRHLIE